MSKKKRRSYRESKKRMESRKSEENEKSKKSGMKSSVLAVIFGVVIIVGVILAVKSMNVNIPPTQPYVKYPQDDQKDVPRDVKLEWGCEDPNGDKLSYDLYLGEGTPVLIATSLNFPAYRVELLPGREYTWRVVARDGRGGVSRSPVWRFETADDNPPETPKALNPTNGETITSTSVVLSWTSSDPDGDEVFYDLYLDGRRIAKDLKKSSYTVRVAPGEKHLWRVVAKDRFGAHSEADWVFYVKKPNRPPKVEITSVKVENRFVKVWWRAFDPDGDPVRSEVFLDGKSVDVLPGSPVETTYGEHKIDIVATDGEDETKVSTDVLVKKPLPPQKPKIRAAKKSLPGKYAVAWESPTVNGEKLSFEVYVDGNRVSKTDKNNEVLNLSVGRHRIKVVAINDLGEKKSSEITVDIIKPVLRISAPNVVWRTSVNVRWDFPIEAVYSLYVDGKEVYHGESKEASLKIGYGEHKLKVVAKAFGKVFESEKTVLVEKPYNVLALSNGEGIFLINVSDRMRISDSMGGIFGKKIDYKKKTAVIVGDGGEVYIIDVEDGYMVLLSILSENALDAVVGNGAIYVLTNQKILKIGLNGNVLEERDLPGGLSLSFDGDLYVGMDEKIMELDPDLNVLRSWNTKGSVREVLRDGEKLISVENWGVEIIGGNSLELPDPRDMEKTQDGYVVADNTLGIVFLNSNLQVTGSVDIPGAVSAHVSKEDVIAFGRGVYRIRDGEVVEKLGRGEAVLSTCRDFVATDGGLYLKRKKVFSESVGKVRCSSGKAAFSSHGDLFIYDGNVVETGISVSDFGVWNGEVYAVSDGKLLLVGRRSASYIAKAESFGDGYYSFGRYVYGLGGGKIVAHEKVLDVVASDGYVALLEENSIEIFKGEKFVSRIPGAFQGVDIGGGRVYAYSSDKVYAFSVSGKEIWNLPLGDNVRDLEYDDSRLRVSNGSNGLVVMDPRDGSVIYDEPVLICGGGK